MNVDNDIYYTIRLLKNTNDNKNYRKVKLFTNYSLKHFKKYKLNDKEVLSRINNLDEILDLLSYNANVTCFSTNILDKYFLKLLVEMHNISRKKYMDYIFKDYGEKNITFSKKYYDMIKYSLDDDTLYFFDEIYKFCNNTNIDISNLIVKQPYEKEILQMYVKNYLLGKYDQIKNNNKLSYLKSSDGKITLNNLDNTYDFINLSYNLDVISDKPKMIARIKKFNKFLKENGKIQGFISKEELNLNNCKRIETRSITDPYTKNDECKKEYAYVYKKSQ